MTPPHPFGLDPIDPVALARATGLRHVELPSEVESTMDRARELADDLATPTPALVVADRQTAGRGRRGAGWWQPPGSLVASLVFGGQTVHAGPPPCWSLACGIALAEAIAALAGGVRPRLKWPNDVEVAGRKLAGILVETAPAGRVVVGLGVNTTGSAAAAPPPLRDRLVTLPDLIGAPLRRESLLTAFIPRLELLMRSIAADPAELGRRYRPLCCLADTHVRVFAGTREITGRCLGIAADGGLVVETAGGPTTIHAGSLAPPGTAWAADR